MLVRSHAHITTFKFLVENFQAFMLQDRKILVSLTLKSMIGMTRNDQFVIIVMANLLLIV